MPLNLLHWIVQRRRYGGERADKVVALDEGLTWVETASERRASIVACPYFVGLTIEEPATVLGISSRPVKRAWTVAKHGSTGQ